MKPYDPGKRRREIQRYAETGRCVTCSAPAQLYMTCERCRKKARLREGWIYKSKPVAYVAGCDHGG